MRASNSPHIHIRQFLEQQCRERYRAFVIHGPPRSGKTTFAHTLTATTSGIVYLDLLRYVVERPELVRQIDLIDASRLRELVVAYAVETRPQVLLVDEIDFLVCTWGGDLSPFLHMVDSLSVTLTSAIIGFLVQTRHPLETWYLPNTAQQNRILCMSDIFEIMMQAG